MAGNHRKVFPDFRAGPREFRRPFLQHDLALVPFFRNLIERQAQFAIPKVVSGRPRLAVDRLGDVGRRRLVHAQRLQGVAGEVKALPGGRVLHYGLPVKRRSQIRMELRLDIITAAHVRQPPAFVQLLVAQHQQRFGGLGVGRPLGKRNEVGRVVRHSERHGERRPIFVHDRGRDDANYMARFVADWSAGMRR